MIGNGLLSREVGLLPPSTRKTLEQNKDKPIKRLTLWRKPIDVNSLLKIIKSAGLVNYKHDNLFHLGCSLGYTMTSDDSNLEFTEYIKFYNGGIPPKATERMNVAISQNYASGRPTRGGGETVSAKFTTVGELFDKLRKQMGPNWTEYDVLDRNCQIFITNVLKALGVADKENLAFVNQDVKEVIENLGGPFATALAGAAVAVKKAQNVLQEGQGGYGENDKLEIYNFGLPRCTIQN
jgi:hypothetical protein